MAEEIDLERQPGSGFCISIAQKDAREVQVEVSRKSFERYVSIPAGSPPSPPARYEMSWEIFPRYEWT
jgi:hypothetical protein